MSRYQLELITGDGIEPFDWDGCHPGDYGSVVASLPTPRQATRLARQVELIPIRRPGVQRASGSERRTFKCAARCTRPAGASLRAGQASRSGYEVRRWRPSRARST